jgi:hypothetical protein
MPFEVLITTFYLHRKVIPMRTLLILFAFSFLFTTTSCKKDTAADHQVSFVEPVGTANGNGEYTIEGQIISPVRLDKIILTKQGQSTPFIEDVTTAKNKTEHTFSYQVTSITQDTYIVMDFYNLEGGKSTSKFLIKK